MKHLLILFSLVILLAVAAATTVSAQGGIITKPTPTPTAVPDTDGDGLPDTDDLCPTIPGPRENRGCPGDNPPNDPPANDPPGGQPPASDPPTGGDPNPSNPGVPPVEVTEEPFRPAALPGDGCYVTAAVNNNINVRKAPDFGADILGYLMPGKVYEAHGYVLQGTDIWFVLTGYEGTDGTMGYASRTVLLASACGELAMSPAAPNPWEVNVKTAEVEEDSNTTIEYCVYQEVGEAGVFKEVCYEIEIPEGCIVTTSEAGVFTIDCGDEPVTVNPLFDDLPADGFQVPTRNSEIGIVLGVKYGPDGGSDNPTIEYCVYQEVGEAGIFKEVCYEIEVPVGCWLETAEAGVFTIKCRPEIGGEVSFTTNRNTADGNNGIGLIIRTDNIPGPHVKVFSGETGGAIRDCNNNGIDDLDEFWPPDCFGQLTTDGGDNESRKEDPGWWTEVLGLNCGGDFVIVTEIDDEGDEVVTDAACG